MSDVFVIVIWAIIAVSAAILFVSLFRDSHWHRRESVLKPRG